MRGIAILGAFAMSLARAAGAGGQTSDSLRHIAVGYGLDTTTIRGWGDFAWKDPVGDIFRAWRSYLTQLMHARSEGSRQPSPLWSAAEQREWPDADLADLRVVVDAPATVTDIRPAFPGSKDEYIVKTLFASSRLGADTTTREVKPLALTRVYAVREGGRWVFANALPRLTGTWRRERVGPITYVVEPGYPFSRARAERAVRFADSLAAAFEVPRISEVTYFLTTTPDEMNRIVGDDYLVGTYGGRGNGYSSHRDRLIFTGDPLLGEEYRHELVHFVLAPLSSATSNGALTEGLASWLGGTIGLDPATMFKEYARFLREHPTVTVDSALTSTERDEGFRPAGALLCLMAYEHGGVPAVRELVAAGRGTEALRSTASRVLGLPWPELATAWRARALRFDERSP